MEKAFNTFTWRNRPNLTTPLDAENLNKINTALDIVDTRVIVLDEKQGADKAALTELINAKYTKPQTGIPKGDLSADVQTSLGKADDAYQKPSDGIPSSDLSSEIQESLDNADNSVLYTPQSPTSTEKATARGNINSAAPDGYYGESGGVYQYSTNFLGKNTPQNAHDIVYRPTASQFSGQSWSQDSISGQTATIQKIKGKTLVFNQLVENGNFATTNNWDSLPKVPPLYFTVSNNVATVSGNVIYAIRQIVPIVANHKYYVRGSIKTDVASSVSIGMCKNSSMLGREFNDATSWKTTEVIFTDSTATSSDTFDIRVRNNVAVAVQIQTKNIMLIDLTKMYGAGNEPATVEEFKAQFPLDYYTYESGKLISLNATGLKTNGFNQWDEGDFGHWVWFENDDNPSANENYWGTGHKQPCLPNTIYKYTRLHSSSNTNNYISFFDADGHYISRATIITTSSGNGSTFTTPNNAHYFAFCFSVSAYPYSSYNNDICINISWSGIRNGEYEPYWDSELSLPIATYFGEDGMGDYDWLTKNLAHNGGTKLQFTGNESWVYNYGVFYLPNLSPQASVGTAIRYKSNYYSQYPSGPSVALNRDKSFQIIQAGSIISFQDDSVTSLADWKTKLQTWNSQGKPLTVFYELAEPVETPINPPLNLTYRCDDFGTEMLLPQNDDEPVTAPMDADIVYEIDYEGEVRNMPINTISKASMDNFISAFNSSGIGTITQTWDSTNNRYTYTITQNGGE